METNMSEASTTEPSTNDELSESTVSAQTNDSEVPNAAAAEQADSNDMPKSAAEEEQADPNDSPEPTSTEQDETDDWAAAMAEQATATNETTEDDSANSNDGTTPVFEQFSKDGGLTSAKNDIDMILDIPVQLTVELGRTKIAIKNLMQLAQGSVVELDGLAGEPMDVLVNGCLIAQGEVVVVNDKFGIRLTDIITPSERIRKLNR